MDANSVLETYLKMISESGKSPFTHLSYKRDLNKFFGYFKFQDITDIEKVTKDDFRQFILSMDTLSNNSRNAVIRVISAFLTYLIDDSLISQENISTTKFGKSRFLKVEKKAAISLTVEEIDKVIGATKSLQEKFMFELILGTGLRESEVVSLRPSDFNEDGSFKIVGKGGNEYILQMSDRLHQLMQIYLSQRDLTKEYLFYSRSRTGKNPKLSPLSVNARLKEALSKTDIPIERQKLLSAHKLRATLITWVIKNHGIEAARQAARHQNLNTTQIYNNAGNLGREAMKDVHYR